MAPHPHHIITKRPLMTHDSADLLTYTHGLVSSLPPANYSRASMNVINHIYIGIIPRSLHATIPKLFSPFVTEQQCAHERRFPWDHVNTHATKTPDLLDAMNYFQSSQDMELYRLILKAWNKVSIALLQHVYNLQTIVEALVFKHARANTRLKKRARA